MHEGRVVRNIIVVDLYGNLHRDVLGGNDQTISVKAPRLRLVFQYQRRLRAKHFYIRIRACLATILPNFTGSLIVGNIVVRISDDRFLVFHRAVLEGQLRLEHMNRASHILIPAIIAFLKSLRLDGNRNLVLRVICQLCKVRYHIAVLVRNLDFNVVNVLRLPSFQPPVLIGFGQIQRNRTIA